MNLIKKFYPLIISIVIILFFSCNSKEERCFKSRGPENEEKRMLEYFNKLDIKNMFTIVLCNDTNFFVIIKTGENLISQIKTTVVDNTLICEDINKCKWIRNLDKENIIEIHAPKLESITTRNYAKILSNNFTSQSLKIDVFSSITDIDLKVNVNDFTLKVHSGTGNYNLTGTCDSMYIYSKGKSKINFSNLLANKVFVNNNSTGNCMLNVIQRLDIEYVNTGEVVYCGNPIVNYLNQNIDKSKVKSCN